MRVPLFTPTERRLYYAICAKPRSARELMRVLWPVHEQDWPRRGIKQHICNLRRKLRERGEDVRSTRGGRWGRSVYYWSRLSKDGIPT